MAPAASAARARLGRATSIERITHEDRLTRIEELRVGGETQSITVQPKNGAPAYQVQPDNGQTGAGDSGKRTGNAGRAAGAS